MNQSAVGRDHVGMVPDKLRSAMNSEPHHLNRATRLIVINNSTDDLTQIKDSINSNSLKRRGHRRSSRSRPTDQDLDDCASVCSSSNSEHSVGTSSSKRKSRKGHRKCPIHSTGGEKDTEGSTESSPVTTTTTSSATSVANIVITNPAGGSQSKESQLTKCTCKTSRSSRNDKGGKLRGSQRPEPEGGLPSESCKGFLGSDDLESLIWSNDPIFSDLDDVVDPVMDAQILEESNRLHRKSDSTPGTDGLFSAAQSLNSSTIIKLAIIGNELKNVKDASLRRAEGDVTSLSRRVSHLEQSFTQAEKTLNLATEHLTKAISVYSDYNREELTRQLQERQQLTAAGLKATAVGAAGQSEASRRVHSCSSGVTSVKNSSCKYHVTDLDREMTASRLEACEWKVQELEDELRVLTCAGKARNNSAQEHQDLIQRLSAQLVDAENLANEAEKQAINIGLEYSRLQDETTCDKKKYKPISARLNCSFSDLSSY